MHLPHNTHWGNIFTSVGTVGAVWISLFLAWRARRQDYRNSLADAHRVIGQVYCDERELPTGIKVVNGSASAIMSVAYEAQTIDRYKWTRGVPAVGFIRQEDLGAFIIHAGSEQVLRGFLVDTTTNEPITEPSLWAARQMVFRVFWTDKDGNRWRRLSVDYHPESDNPPNLVVRLAVRLMDRAQQWLPNAWAWLTKPRTLSRTKEPPAG